jgi:sec-independent protein translocase protein TatA
MQSMEQFAIHTAAFGIQQIILILIIVVLLFGAKKIPELMKGVGKGIKEFKDATNEDPEENKGKSKT